MEKIKTKSAQSTIERKILLILTLFFVILMAALWAFSMNLRKNIVQNNSMTQSDVQALVQVERLRSLVQSEISNSLSYFLLGSSSLFDEQRENKKDLTNALSAFEKNFALPQASEIMKRVDSLRQQEKEFFDQAMDFRAKQTESKIVGQFYRSKTAPLLTQIDKSLSELTGIYNAEFDKNREAAQAAARGTEGQIPQALTWFTGIAAGIFLAMILLVLRVLSVRAKHLAERTRLYESAKEATLTRDDVIAAVSQDFIEPLEAISHATDILKRPQDAAQMKDGIDLIDTSVTVIKDRVQDILDQTKSEMGHLSLRVEQMGLDGILEEARLLLEPLAKQKDIRLEMAPVNPPVLAFIDHERVIRVLSNLIGNAIKFSPHLSKVNVKVRSDQQFVYVSVKDSGPGIPEKQLPQIFDRFWQNKKTAEEGPGIGLAVAKTIIEAHGGLVTVESRVGHGSTFTFSLPRRRPTGALIKRSAASSAAKTSPRAQTGAELSH